MSNDIKEIKIKSSNIKSIFYDVNKSELYIFFRSNHLYIYKCDDKLYDSFVSSQDKNKFFEDHIKNKQFIFKFWFLLQLGVQLFCFAPNFYIKDGGEVWKIN